MRYIRWFVLGIVFGIAGILSIGQDEQLCADIVDTAIAQTATY